MLNERRDSIDFGHSYDSGRKIVRALSQPAAFMSKRRILVRARHTLLISAIVFLPLQAIALAASTKQSELSTTVLKGLTPEGYKVEKAINCTLNKGTQHEYLIALSDVDSDAIPARPVMILLVAVGKKIAVEDRVILHNDASTGNFWDGPPNYSSGISREKVGRGDLFLVRSVLSGGGSGSLHYFDFYRPEGKKLRLVKSFSHGRMERTYFAVYRNAVYDAERVCTRGERRGRAYVYTCYLQVTKYTFDGQAIRPVGSERMREQHGNRFLEEKYWFMSVLKALRNNEIFSQVQ